mmetsp:Transcript_1872/g.11232  ORF Transcript_1872/g.11232 Transcript_1872/m.11232 type:complete len:216 (-) Transcript_1872:3058-3705(-)
MMSMLCSTFYASRCKSICGHVLFFVATELCPGCNAFVQLRHRDWVAKPMSASRSNALMQSILRQLKQSIQHCSFTSARHRHATRSKQPCTSSGGPSMQECFRTRTCAGVVCNCMCRCESLRIGASFLVSKPRLVVVWIRVGWKFAFCSHPCRHERFRMRSKEDERGRNRRQQEHHRRTSRNHRRYSPRRKSRTANQRRKAASGQRPKHSQGRVRR